jgi:hypothetical protein
MSPDASSGSPALAAMSLRILLYFARAGLTHFGRAKLLLSLFDPPRLRLDPIIGRAKLLPSLFSQPRFPLDSVGAPHGFWGFEALRFWILATTLESVMSLE